MRKSFVFIFVAVFAISGCSNKDVQNSGQSISDDFFPVGYFGEEIDDQDVSSLNDLVAVLESGNDFQGKVIGEIKEVCVKKGCWMSIDLPNGETMRVTFKDYGFFVPKNSHGFPVIIEGIATRKVTDVGTLRHYAEDAGKSAEEIEAITSPEKEYAFEAIGVIIRENA
jgi:hypothetical protein